MSTTIRRLVLHPSLVRPTLLAGGDRHLTILLWTSVFALIFGAGIRPLSIAVGMALGIVGQLGLIRAANADSHWFPVYRRHVQYQKFYPAHSSARARTLITHPLETREGGNNLCGVKTHPLRPASMMWSTMPFSSPPVSCC